MTEFQDFLNLNLLLKLHFTHLPHLYAFWDNQERSKWKQKTLIFWQNELYFTSLEYL